MTRSDGRENKLFFIGEFFLLAKTTNSRSFTLLHLINPLERIREVVMQRAQRMPGRFVPREPAPGAAQTCLGYFPASLQDEFHCAGLPTGDQAKEDSIDADCLQARVNRPGGTEILVRLTYPALKRPGYFRVSLRDTRLPARKYGGAVDRRLRDAGGRASGTRGRSRQEGGDRLVGKC